MSADLLVGAPLASPLLKHLQFNDFQALREQELKHHEHMIQQRVGCFGVRLSRIHKDGGFRVQQRQRWSPGQHQSDVKTDDSPTFRVRTQY